MKYKNCCPTLNRKIHTSEAHLYFVIKSWHVAFATCLGMIQLGPACLPLE